MAVFWKGKWKWVLLLLIPLAAAFLLLAAGRDRLPAGATDAERRAFLTSFGWELGEGTDRGTVRIPAEFDAVYENYNGLQLEQGFDLKKYAGKEAGRFQYEITNYPGDNKKIYANLLIYNGKIIGGDVYSAALDGFIHGFSIETKEN